MSKSKLILGLSVFLILFSSSNAFAFKKESFVTYSVPVDSTNETNITKSVDLIVKEATHSANPVTFYLDYDTVKDATIAAFFKKIIKDYPYHKLGLWTKVSKTLLTDTTPYQGEKNMNEAMKNLTGYLPDDRHKLIDQMANEYLTSFGTYPQTIMDDYVDSTSADYWAHNYGVIGSLNLYGELGLKMTISDNAGNSLFNRYFPYLMSSRNGLVPGRTREMTQRFVVSPGFSLVLNPNIDMSLPEISDKQLSELTYLGIVSPIGKNTADDIKKWTKIYKELNDKYSLRWLDQNAFADLFLARYPYYSPTFSRKLEKDNKQYWIVFGKDYFAALNLSDKTLANLSMFDDHIPESYWFEYNKQPELSLTTSNIAVDQKVGIGTDFVQDTEYSRTWVVSGDSKIDFLPEKINIYPPITELRTLGNVKIKSGNKMTSVFVPTTTRNIYWPFVMLGLFLVTVYVLQRRK